MNKPKPEVGQTLYSLNINNAARWSEQKLTPVIVKSVGRKYFTCGPPESNSKYLDIKYHLDTWREKSDYVASSELYSCVEDFENEKYAQILYNNIAKKFKSYTNPFSLGKLKKISEILDE